MRIMGIDVGTARLGWSVIDKTAGTKSSLQIVNYGCITTKSTQAMPERLEQIYTELTDLIKEYKPRQIAIESLFFFKNQTTVMTVSQARGVILLASQQQRLEIFEYTPLQVKMAVTGYGRAEKPQVQKMVKLILKLKDIPKPDDAADAVAIAITHANTAKLK